MENNKDEQINKNEESSVDFEKKMKEEFRKTSNEALKKIDELKNKFDSVDSLTKKKIVAALGAVTAGLILAASLKKNKKEEKSEYHEGRGNKRCC